MSELCAVTVNENGLDVWKRKIDDFAINDAKETILFPSTLTKKNRKVLREYALSLGLEFKMNKIGCNRSLTISKTREASMSASCEETVPPDSEDDLDNWKKLFDDFATNDAEQSITFPLLIKQNRVTLEKYAWSLGLGSRLIGEGGNKFLSILKTREVQMTEPCLVTIPPGSENGLEAWKTREAKMSEPRVVTIPPNIQYPLEAWKKTIDNFAINDAEQTVTFPSKLTKKVRKSLNKYALLLGLKSETTRNGGKKCLTISKKSGAKMPESSSESCDVPPDSENGLEAWKKTIDNFAINDAEQTVTFPSKLTKKVRKSLNKYALLLGLKSETTRNGGKKCLTISKKRGAKMLKTGSESCDVTLPPDSENGLNAWKTIIDDFARNDVEQMVSFPSSLSNVDRKALHNYALALGLKSKLLGKGANRCLTISKQPQKVKKEMGNEPLPLALSEKSVDLLDNLFQRYPVTDVEKNLSIAIHQDESSSTDVKIPFAFNNTPNNIQRRLTIPPECRNERYKEFRQNLPIFPYRQQILDKIHDNSVLVISGETGSGKTTQIPQYILEEFASKRRKCRIICTQPRRLAATSIAERVSLERNEMLGRTVGYQIRLDSCVSEQTNLIYTTSGYLLRSLTGSNNRDVFKSMTHLLLDEVHEREKITDFLLIAIKDVLHANPHLKIILMSATLDSEIFSKYFDDCPTLNLPGRLFSTEIFYLAEVLQMTKYKTDKMETYMKTNKGPNILRQELEASQNGSKEADQAVSNRDDPQLDEDAEFFDECLDECSSAGSFDQIYYLSTEENMPINYVHSTKSCTALMIAAEKGFVDVVTMLLDLGADAALQNTNGQCALDYAVQNNHAHCIQILQQYQSEPQPATNTALAVNDEREAAMKKFCLAAYQHSSTRGNEIDHDLLLATIKYVHFEKPTDGSILVFLPGHDDIMTQKVLIETQLFCQNYQLFVLHSEMNNGRGNDQKEVFQRLPLGMRKIILSTNIAETSLTIDDVVYVIDCGKVKQKSYDSVSDTTCLTSTWISQACAKQRAGRAGRTRDGQCYRMYSLDHYETMEKYTLPEILRVPLTDVCLNAKILAAKISIEEFLLRALQPPPVSSIRQSMALLKRIDALDENENITYLGIHLADLPIEAQLGKCLLYAIMTKCIDPVITIVSALSVRDPFILPMNGEESKIDTVKTSFTQGVLSDHLLLLNAYKAWSASKYQYQEEAFAHENCISNGNMEMIHGVRRLIFRHLNTVGIINENGPNNARYLNENSNNWTTIKACLTAGCYPNLCRVNRRNGQIFTKNEKRLLPHLSSVLRKGKNVKMDLSDSPYDWIIHGEKSRVTNLTLVKTNTLVASLNIVLFGGPMFLNIQQSEIAEQHDELDEEDENELQQAVSLSQQLANQQVFFSIDDWITFTSNAHVAGLLCNLRRKFNAVFVKFLKDVTMFQVTEEDKLILTAVQEILLNEDLHSGVRNDLNSVSVNGVQLGGGAIFESPFYNNAIPKPRRRNDPRNYVERRLASSRAARDLDNWRTRNDHGNSTAYQQSLFSGPNNWQTNRNFGNSAVQQQPAVPAAAATNWQEYKAHGNSTAYETTNRNFGNSVVQQQPAVPAATETNWQEYKAHGNSTAYQQSNVSTAPIENWQTVDSTANARAKLLRGLYVPDTIPFGKTINPMGPSMLLFHPQYTKYFIICVPSITKLRESVFTNRWFFQMPISRFRNIERQFPNHSIILFIYVNDEAAICSVGQFRSITSSSYEILNLLKWNPRSFEPIVKTSLPRNAELSTETGDKLLEYCRNLD